MKKLMCSLSVVALAGCASVPLPRGVAEIALVPVPSAAVEVHRPRFRMTDGDLELEGYLFRQHKAETTADTHVDIVFLDAAGSELAVDTTSFSPRSLPRPAKGPKPHAYFRVAILRVPEGTRAIEVRAHDGPHEVPPARASENR